VSPNLGSRHGCLKFSNSVILLMNIVIYIGTRQFGIFLLIVLTMHGNRLKRENKRDYLTCTLSTNVTPNKFWKLCGSCGIHSKRSNSNIDSEPNEINDHFASFVNNCDILDNSDIPSGSLGDGEFTFDEVGQFGILDALESISIVMPVEYP
jgi:hypothetical protein